MGPTPRFNVRWDNSLSCHSHAKAISVVWLLMHNSSASRSWLFFAAGPDLEGGHWYRRLYYYYDLRRRLLVLT